MMKVGEKLGMTKEAQIRRVRYWEGHYYDSVKYGVLREEWNQKEWAGKKKKLHCTNKRDFLFRLLASITDLTAKT